MIQGNQTFAYEIRVLICNQCSAPLPAPTAGGVAQCEYCGASRQVAPRPTFDPLCAPPAAISEAERLSSLRHQLDSYWDNISQYSFSLPPTFLDALLAEFNSRGTSDPELLRMFQEAFPQVHAAAVANPTEPQTARGLCWLARAYWNVLSAHDQFLVGRAVLEASAEVLHDPGYRHLLYMEISKAARSMGDLAAADAWSSLCHPRPMHIDLDSNYRVALGGLALVRGQWDHALGWVGRALREVPIAPACERLSMLIRTAAYEGAGQQALADQAFAEAVADDSLEGRLHVLDINDSIAPAKQTAARWLERRRKTRMRVAMVAILVIVLVLVLGVIKAAVDNGMFGGF